MKRNTPVTIGLATSVLMVVLAAAWPMEAQDRPATYPSMAPLNQYLMDRERRDRPGTKRSSRVDFRTS